VFEPTAHAIELLQRPVANAQFSGAVVLFGDHHLQAQQVADMFFQRLYVRALGFRRAARLAGSTGFSNGRLLRQCLGLTHRQTFGNDL
jgi:hypothetical protein